MNYWHNGWWPMGGLMWIAWVLLGVLLIVILAWVLHYGTRGDNAHRSPRSSPPREQETPEAILKKRYARGEISKEEYERMREDLRR